MRTDRMRVLLVAGLLSFHVVTYLGLGIVFLPHCVAILSILPWERLPDATRRLRARVLGGRPAEVSPAGAAPPG